MMIWRAIVIATVLAISGVAAATDNVTREQALSTVQSTARMMTFKDTGFEAGKLHKSWKYLAAQQLSVEESGDRGYVIKAHNEEFERVLYFSVAPNGQVIAVSATNPVTIR